MEPALLVAATWLVFVCSHFLLAEQPVRGALIRRLGERGFVVLFFAVAALTFALWVCTTAAVRLEGAPGLALAGTPWVYPLAFLAIVTGIAVAAGSFATYPSSPAALLASEVREPRGVERVTRHPFFVGFALFGAAHAVIVPTLAQAAFFAGLAFHAALGVALQDRKLAVRLGAPYRAYQAKTSILPFAAILSGRQRLAAGDQPWLAYAVGALLALGLRQVHGHLFDHGGLWILVAVLGGASFAGLAALRVGARRAQHA
jgi:uncharacterized membrane protein